MRTFLHGFTKYEYIRVIHANFLHYIYWRPIVGATSFVRVNEVKLPSASPIFHVPNDSCENEIENMT